MKISGITIVRNAIQYGYPAVEAIKSILPICDEFIVNVGDSTDGTLELIKSINDPKIKIVQRQWDMNIGQEVLTRETEFAMKQCSGDWIFYVQTDELIHEDDLIKAKKYMQRYLNSDKVDGFHFKWLHFYGSFYRYRIDSGWFQKQIRIIRNNGTCESHDGAWGFRRKDKSPIRTIKTPLFIYHYGWVQDEKIMSSRRVNAQELGFAASFHVGEFSASISEIFPLLKSLGQDNQNTFKDIEEAVNWLNRTIIPFQKYIEANQPDCGVVQGLIPANFSQMSESQLQSFALTVDGQRLKRFILSKLFPKYTPRMHFAETSKNETKYTFGDLNRFPVFFGTHPFVMKKLVEMHSVSQKDRQEIQRKYWWNPLLWFRIRYKTGRRQKNHIK